MDRISHLPDFILHHILSFLKTPAELVRMSVLSKTWFHLTASFPILDFCINDFTSRESVSNFHRARARFFKYVQYTISRFRHQDATAYRFKLIPDIRDPAELRIVDRCLQLVLEKGVRELVIDFADSSYVSRYHLPNTLLSVSVLESLTIRRCALPSSFMVDAVNLKSLVKLSLADIYIDDEVIKYITTSCPLLQVLGIRRCYGFKSLCVYGHQHVQEVCMYDTPVEIIDVEAPNLSRLFVGDLDRMGAPRMNLASCKKLKTVAYMGNPLPNSNGFTNFLSNFPFVENLALLTKYKCNNLKLSSHSLRTLVLCSDFDLEDIELNTPNLVSFTSHWPIGMRKSWSPWSFTHLEAGLQCYHGAYIDALWFLKLRQFLDKNSGFKVLILYINAMYSQKFTDLEKLKSIELPPYELEHVELQLEAHEESLAHIAFVDAVLWCCRPLALTLRSSCPLTDFEDESDVVEFTYEKLLQQNQGHTDIRIFFPPPSLMTSLCGEGKAIGFVREDALQEEADSRTNA